MHVAQRWCTSQTLLIIGLMLGTLGFTSTQAAAQTTQPAEPADPGPAVQKVGGVSFAFKSLTLTGGNYTLELAIEPDGRDIEVNAIAVNSTAIIPSGSTIKANYVQLGDNSGARARGTLLTGHKHSLIVRFPITDQTLKELPRVTVVIRSANRSLTVNYVNLKVQQ